MIKEIKNKTSIFLEKLGSYAFSTYETEFKSLQDSIIEDMPFLENATPEEAMNFLFYDFLFEEMIKDGKRISELYVEDNPDNLPLEDIEILKKWKRPIHSMLRVEERHKDYLMGYNLLNEKSYKVVIMDKTFDIKQVGVHSFLKAPLLPINDFYVAISTAELLPAVAKLDAYEHASVTLMHFPEELVYDNPDKLKEIHEGNNARHQKFLDFFGAEEVISDGKSITKLNEAFFHLLETGKKEIEDVQSLLTPPTELYFDNKTIQEIENSHADVLKDDAIFSHCHDLAIRSYPDIGHELLPYYQTFKTILSSETFEEIEGFEECIRYYLENPIISPYAVEKALVNKDIAVKAFQQAYNEKDITSFEDIEKALKVYKYSYYKENKTSLSSLYDYSQTIKDLTDLYMETAPIQKNLNAYKDTGRNDPCPCGSGKKFKKCCYTKVEALI